MKFDINQEKQLISEGTYFWCKCCVTAKPISERASFNSEYCHGCSQILNEVKKERKNSEPVRWSPGGQVCIIDGKGYKINKGGKTYCVGPVDENGKTRSGDSIQNIHQTPPVKKNDVAKIKHDTLPIPTKKQTRIMQHPKRRGRPQKKGNIHRTTVYRRSKQAVMAL